MPLSNMSEPLTIAQYWTRPILLLFAVGMGLGILEERLPRSFTIPRPFLLMLGVLFLWYAYTLGGPLTDSEYDPVPHRTDRLAALHDLGIRRCLWKEQARLDRVAGRTVRRCLLQRLSVPYHHHRGASTFEGTGDQPSAVRRRGADSLERLRACHVSFGGTSDPSNMPPVAVDLRIVTRREKTVRRRSALYL